MSRNLYYNRFILGYLQVSGLIYEESQLLSDRYASINRQLIAGSGLIGGGALTADRTFHIQIGSGLYLLDDLVGFDISFGDSRYALSGSVASSGSVSFSGLSYSGLNDVVDTGWASGLSARFDGTNWQPINLSQIFAPSGFSGTAFSGLSYSGLNDVIDSPWISGNSSRYDGINWLPINLSNVFQASGLYQLSGTSYTKTESDTRYAFQATQIIAGSGLIGGGDLSADRTIHVQVGSGLYLQDNLVGVDFTQVSASGNYALSGTSYTKVESDNRYAISGYHYLAGSGLISNNETYHVQVGSGLYLLDDLVGFDTGFGDIRYSLSGSSNSSSYSGLTDVQDTGWLSGLSARFDGTNWVPINLNTIYVLSGTSSQSFSGLSYSGLNDVVDSVWLSGLSSRYDGTNWQPTDLHTIYALSGIESVLAGSGLYTNAQRSIYHVGEGFGITVSNSGVMAKTSDLDTRYALSGSVTQQSSFANIMLLMGG